MSTNYILFLPSWYPNKVNILDGNFVQRHAEVASQGHKIVCLYLNSMTNEKEFVEEQVNAHLTEYRLYFVKSGLAVVRPLQYLYYYRKGLKHITKVHGTPKGVHVHVAWFAGLFAYLMKWRYGIPYIVTEHWSGLLPQQIHQLSWAKRRLLQMVFRQARAITAVSSHLAEGIKQLTHKPVVILPNVVDSVFFEQDSDEKFTPFTYISISNFAPLKRNPEIVKAFIQLKSTGSDAQLILIGEEGTDKQLCRQLAAESSFAQDIQIRDMTTKEEIAQLLAQSHALVQYSQFETQGITVLESLAVGNPVITSDILPFKYFVTQELGVLVGSFDTLVKAMQHIETNYAHYSLSPARKYIYDQYSIAALSKQFKQLYTHFD